jgi:hypothetical protein
MVKGLDVFRDYFKGNQDKYVLIGGEETLCANVEKHLLKMGLVW